MDGNGSHLTELDWTDRGLVPGAVHLPENHSMDRSGISDQASSPAGTVRNAVRDDVGAVRGACSRTIIA